LREGLLFRIKKGDREHRILNYPKSRKSSFLAPGVGEFDQFCFHIALPSKSQNHYKTRVVRGWSTSCIKDKIGLKRLGSSVQARLCPFANPLKTIALLRGFSRGFSVGIALQVWKYTCLHPSGPFRPLLFARLLRLTFMYFDLVQPALRSGILLRQVFVILNIL
jgi:hypothetical protein